MKQIGRTMEHQAAEAIVIEAIRITKLANPKALISFGESDIDFLIGNIARDYLSANLAEGKKLLDLAVSKFYIKSQSDANINLGDFTRICHAEAAHLKSLQHTQELINPEKRISTKGKARQNISKIKEMMEKSQLIKPLPYNKDMRVGLDGDKLFENSVTAGHVVPAESIKNQELKELYGKAWSIGLTRDEKSRYLELIGAGTR